jgi:hypothetical protein
VVTFQPDMGPAGIGETDEDGSFRALTGRPGNTILPGQCKVAIAPADRTRSLPIPRKYFSIRTSGLTAEIKRGKNTINFEIPLEP